MPDSVELIETLSLDHEISSRPLFFTSDHHLPGDRNSPKADFDQAKAEKFIRFQKEIVGRDLHVITGDFLEGWQFEAEKIFAANQDIIDLLLASNVVFLKGNHDGEMLENWEKGANIPLYNEWTSNRKKIVARHGHSADPLNNDDGAWFGEFMTKAAGFFEELHIPADETWSWLKNLAHGFHAKTDDDNFNAQAPIYKAYATSLVERYNSDCVIFGHTHRASLEIIEVDGRDRILANTGTWINGEFGNKEDCFVEVQGSEVKLVKYL